MKASVKGFSSFLWCKNNVTWYQWQIILTDTFTFETELHITVQFSPFPAPVRASLHFAPYPSPPKPRELLDSPPLRVRVKTLETRTLHIFSCFRSFFITQREVFVSAKKLESFTLTTPILVFYEDPFIAFSSKNEQENVKCLWFECAHYVVNLTQ